MEFADLIQQLSPSRERLRDWERLAQDRPHPRRIGYSAYLVYRLIPVAAGLEIVQQGHRGLGRGMLEIMHQHNAFAVFLQLRQHRLPD
jgi:hypothetical protein